MQGMVFSFFVGLPFEKKPKPTDQEAPNAFRMVRLIKTGVTCFL